MTEKRFELKSWSYNHLNAKVYDNLKKEELYLSLYEIVDLLNEVSQSEYDLAKENRKLKDENEQLKQLIKKVLETTPMKHKLAIELKNSVRDLYD